MDGKKKYGGGKTAPKKTPAPTKPLTAREIKSLMAWLAANLDQVQDDEEEEEEPEEPATKNNCRISQ